MFRSHNCEVVRKRMEEKPAFALGGPCQGVLGMVVSRLRDNFIHSSNSTANHTLERMWNKQKSPTVLVRMQCDATTSQKSQAICYKTQHAPDTWPSHSTPRCLFKIKENICLKKDSYWDIHKSVSHNTEELGKSLGVHQLGHVEIN